MIDHEELKKQFQNIRIIGISVSCSVLIYGFVAYLLSRSGPRASQGDHTELLKYSFLIISILGMIAIPTIKSKMLAKSNQEEHGASKSATKLIAKLHAASMFILGICELPGLLGCILVVLTGVMNDFYIFGAISLIGFMMYFPKYPEWEEWLKQELQGL